MVHIVWFKRDLRVHDHAALFEACQRGEVLPVFCWDPAFWQGDDMATQHALFVHECLESLRRDLHALGLALFEFIGSMTDLLALIAKHCAIGSLHSHEETGNLLSYALDQSVAGWCASHAVPWIEYPQNGVVRRLKNRNTWAKKWAQRMMQAQVGLPVQPRLANVPIALHHQFQRLLDADGHLRLNTHGADKAMRQRGGRDLALQCLHTFLNGRASQYRGGISSPLSSVVAGSRLSPYLAWGVLSMRELVQALGQQQRKLAHAQAAYPKGLLAGLAGFESRLHWHCHFMQKLESEPDLEVKHLHPMFNGMRDEAYASEDAQKRLAAWCTGNTGWPLVDACMRCLNATGWMNFRMRAMLMSTASYLLWLHWRETGLHLARAFLDYEPGIHWSQVQMQSGTTGINTLRIYNPIKQAMDQDPEGAFVRKWIPALRKVPNTWIFEPWRMPMALQQDYGCIIGEDYAAPLVEIDVALKQARAAFSQLKKHTAHHADTARIIEKHASRKTMARRSAADRTSAKQKQAKRAGQQSLF